MSSSTAKKKIHGAPCQLHTENPAEARSKMNPSPTQSHGFQRHAKASVISRYSPSGREDVSLRDIALQANVAIKT